MNIPEQTVALYRSIQAPDSLRERVRTQQPGSKSRRTWSPILTAACAAVITLTVLAAVPQPGLLFDGQTIAETPIMLTEAPVHSRVMPAASPPLAAQSLEIQLQLRRADVEDVSVSHGTVSEENGILCWTVPTGSLTDGNATITLKNRKSYLLFCSDAGIWQLVKER